MTSQVTRETIDLNGLLARAKNAAAGAVLLFSGDVRDHSEGRAVDFLEYETHESMAQKQIAEIVVEAKTAGTCIMWKSSTDLAKCGSPTVLLVSWWRVHIEKMPMKPVDSLLIRLKSQFQFGRKNTSQMGRRSGLKVVRHPLLQN